MSCIDESGLCGSGSCVAILRQEDGGLLSLTGLRVVLEFRVRLLLRGWTMRGQVSQPLAVRRKSALVVLWGDLLVSANSSYSV